MVHWLRKSSRAWLLGILSALIGGAAGGVASALNGIVLKPEVFNLGGGLIDTLKFAAGGAVISGIIAVAMYLQKSPLPGRAPAEVIPLHPRDSNTLPPAQ